MADENMRHKNKDVEWFEEDEEEIIWVSKSEIKRDAEALKKLGAKLVEMPAATLAKLELDERLVEAIEFARTLQREAKRRQLQFIGKLLRKMDADPIYQAIAQLENQHNQQQLLLRKLEITRDQLVTKGDDALSEVLADFPAVDRQHLRHLIRLAQKEREQNKPPKAYREIYQYLKQFIID